MIECALFARLARDPELEHVKGDTLPLLTFTAVVDQQHQTEDAPATWVCVETFDDLAEQVAERLVKGTRSYQGRLTADLWQADDGRVPRININVTATALQPLGQIGRQRPCQRLPERGRSAWDRAPRAERHTTQNRAAAARAAVLAEVGRASTFYDDSAEAIRDLNEGRGQ